MANLTTSPITGQKGNREFLIHCSDHGTEIDRERIEEKVLR
jgi:hypothetical protein